ncbi:hypothetical protein [Xylophilus sp.]|uniref:hypothetical protein n=1 Tax=Xylophilus sp. TaxID=2653893 RepID=UPI002D7E8387|nr:hypothetical protein [Xylophilus sp.]
MTRDLFSYLESFASPSASPSPLLVCEGAGQDRPGVADEVLQAAQRVLASQVRGTTCWTRLHGLGERLTGKRCRPSTSVGTWALPCVCSVTPA